MPLIDSFYHLYADDSQLYISFKTDCFADLAQAKSSVELCQRYWLVDDKQHAKAQSGENGTDCN